MTMTMSKNYDDCWKYFIRSQDRNIALCNICKKSLSCKNSSTTGLHRHLEHVHTMQRSEVVSNTSPTSSKRLKHDQPVINKFCVRPTLQELVSKLAAEDGISIHAITRSEFIRQSMNSRGFNLPKNPSDVMDLVFQYYDNVKQELLCKIKKMKAENKKVSISIDEWTSFKNRRYMNVHVYFNNDDDCNFGLIRVDGSCPAEKALKLVDEKLQDFGLSFTKDVVSTSSDGASVMQKFGRLSPAHQQLCYNHALHLAVTSIFYVKKDKTKDAENSVKLSDSDSDKEDNDEIESENFSEEDDEELEPPEPEISLRENVDATIKSIRKIVKVFKNSPVRNSVLQKYVLDNENKELQVLLDCNTRWNTIEIMVERFLRIIGPIKKALLDLKLSHLWSPDNLVTATDILNTLKPVRIAVEALSRKDANLLTSEGVLKFLFQSLEKQDSNLSNELLEAIKVKISLRRDKKMISLLKFLQNPDCIRSEEENQLRQNTDDFFRMSSKTEMVKLAKAMLKRLFTETNRTIINNESISGSANVNVQEKEVVVNKLELSLDQQLNHAISKSLEKGKPCDDEFRSTLREMNIYESTGKITPNLQQLLDALNTIKPTSTQNERNFSISGNFVSKKRTRLSDKAIDVLCFLKHHFIKRK